MNPSLFIFGCIALRLLLAYMIYLNKYTKVLAYLTLIIGLGFLFVFITGIRPTGMEVGGKKIWWNNIRPVHAAFYLIASYMLFRGNKNAWILILADTVFGLGAWLKHYYY